ncbi:hypothetical protein NL676_039411 [Syzygium grande]|nr:hypothetical protein NL676_039411 [Syzygium grande]
MSGLKGYGWTVAGRVPPVTPITNENKTYLETKRSKLGHIYGERVNGHFNNLISKSSKPSSTVSSDPAVSDSYEPPDSLTANDLFGETGKFT